MEEIASLMRDDIPDGRRSIKDSHSNLEKVAEYCEANYFQAENKTAALEESKRYTTQSLASVAYQINTLAFHLLHLLDLQSNELASVESQVNHIAQTVAIHKEKVARREIGVLTTNKNTIRQHKILAPANQEKPIKYVRKPIDFSILDHVGHATKGVMVSHSQTAPRPRRSSSQGAGPAPTQKPPTPPTQVPMGGTLSRRGDYRAPPMIAPPQVPSNYASNYPMGHPRRTPSNCSTLPAAMHTSHLIQHQQQQQVAQIPGTLQHQHQMMSHYQHGQQQMMQMDNHSIHSGSSHYGTHMQAHSGAPPPPSMAAPPSAADHLPAPPPQMMAHSPAAPTQVAPPQQPSGVHAGNISPPLPPPPEELSLTSPTPPPPPPMATQQPQASGGQQTSTSEDPDWAPATYIEKVIAIYDYQADKADELSFQDNALIYVIKKNDDGWYEGVMNGVQGLFPGNYVEPCP